MLSEEIRLGQAVRVTDQADGETFTGFVTEGWSDQEWMVRTPHGELTGPWSPEELTMILVSQVR